ncbi:MAG: DUF1127 domain-containing protein [Geminicoccaceae bacterium]
MELLNRLFESFEIRRHQRRAVRELKSLSPRSLADIGVAEDDIDAVALAAARRVVTRRETGGVSIPALGQRSVA